MQSQSAWLRVVPFLVLIPQGNTRELCVPWAVFDRAVVSMLVSIRIFESDLDVYILVRSLQAKLGRNVDNGSL
jgi:hypothetical protein